MSRAELILRYTLSLPHCHTTIVGTCNPRHLKENIAAATKGPLPADLCEQVTSRVAASATELLPVAERRPKLYDGRATVHMA
jgi:aryl-alcohol dehydrogenase-like predicted oxidoreductase